MSDHVMHWIRAFWGYVSAFVEKLSDLERVFGDYRAGRYAWKLEDVQRLPEPMPATGKQGLWAWEAPAALWEVGFFAGSV
ncbi:MAG TPA: hypothetical protein VNK95_15595 [Caldilineaceae bacterium]|nr:hypothetical protein [Caldilineaceae bacterium]